LKDGKNMTFKEVIFW